MPSPTVGEAIDATGAYGYQRGPFFVVGDPKTVADELEKWVDDGGIDGINLRQFLAPGTAEDFIEHVVPELRRRGRYHESYDDGEALRHRLSGRDRLPASHPAARYRDPARLRD
jgi:hypothetical protein